MIVNRFKGADTSVCLLFNPSTQQETVTRQLFKTNEVTNCLTNSTSHPKKHIIISYSEYVSFPPAAAHTAFVWKY